MIVAAATFLLTNDLFSMCMTLLLVEDRLTNRLHLLRRNRPAKRANVPALRASQKCLMIVVNALLVV